MKKILSIASQTLYQFLSRLSTGIVTLLLTPLLTAHLGLSQYGNYQMIFGFVTLFWILTDFGLNAVIVKEMINHEEKLQNYFSSLLTLRFLNGALVMIVAVLALVFLPYPSIIKIGILIASITIFSQSLMGVGNALFQAKTHFENTFWATVLGSLFLLLSTIVLLKIKSGILSLTLAYSLSYFLMAIASLWLSRKWVKIAFDKTTTLLIPLLKRSLPFGVALLFSLASFKIDSILLAIMPLSHNLKNSDAVAIYSLPYRMFELALAIPTFLMNVLYPILIKKLQQGWGGFRQSVVQIFLGMSLVSFSGIAVTWVLAPFLINLLARTAGFSDSIIILKILILSYPLFFFSSLLMWILMIFERQIDLIWVYGLAFAFNLVTNWILIPQGFYWAASWITVATEGLILVLLGFFVLRLRMSMIILPAMKGAVADTLKV